MKILITLGETLVIFFLRDDEENEEFEVFEVSNGLGLDKIQSHLGLHRLTEGWA